MNETITKTEVMLIDDVMMEFGTSSRKVGQLVNFFFPGQPANVNEMGNIFNDCQLPPLILPSTVFIALPLFLNQHCCLF